MGTSFLIVDRLIVIIEVLATHKNNSKNQVKYKPKHLGIEYITKSHYIKSFTSIIFTKSGPLVKMASYWPIPNYWPIT